MIIKRKRKNLNETFSPQNICHVSTHFYKYVIYIMKYTNTQKTPRCDIAYRLYKPVALSTDYAPKN